ncbi:hypothetical protein HPP92_011154 [Vanilla planifolia]|uniref:Uncharacterized protein n=1 Tax=Vanilla planifolia TaxID=51239 RepID=A0A835V242_VANPL|nr:hypothetical protein HPP92_011154 [Vanilla planifolia]
MGRSEPNLVPEWYKGTTSSAIGNSNSGHLCGSSHSADEHNGVFSSRNRISVSVYDFDCPRSPSSSDRASLRMSSSSDGYIGEENITSRACSSFGRSHRERDWDRDANRDKDLDLRERDRSLYPEDEFSNCPSMVNKSEKESSKLIQSTISGRVDSWVRRNGYESSNGSSFGKINITSISKSSFERDFPSLGNEERHLALDVVRVSSLGLGTTNHNFPLIGASATIGSDAWTSALAEVPLIVGGNGQVISSSIQANLSVSIASSTSTGLNMAETLSQVPTRMQVGAQAPNESQKIEELHRQQILKLRPMIPSMLKNSVGFCYIILF